MTFLAPRYGDRSLADVVPAIGAALGVRLDGAEHAGLVLPEAPSYVLFLVDGLGSRLLERYAHVAPYLSSLRSAAPEATAGVPSTTATSLTSLGTGLPPGAHGVVGFTSRVPGTERLLNALMWPKDIDPVEWQPHPTTFTRLRERGVAVSVVNKREFEGSGLTMVAHRGADFVGADKVGERLAATVAAGAHQPSLTYLYDGDLDWTGHRYGVASSEWLQQLAMIDHEAEQLREALPPATRLVVVADHGMVDSPLESRVDVDTVHELRDGLVLFGGEARFRQLYCQRGAVDDVVATWRSVLGDKAEVLTREEATAHGWFGAVDPTVRPRIGDVVVACQGDAAVISSVDWAYEARLVGMHGSLTPDEMLIPVLVD
ncbi:Type I phosphodiesterase / nucleotide pyrophosphatase [Nocardioides dokdonensis FR1436]|uniref:Type I phosphodiesterase / nucleotide pyrophosphatase n=1 Tax=Nocardioides dokdonensis FR1436 TaxID=1300347 RepID=A0A1A9GQT9_9ACTN|nr:nucleotide pyrophosphatase/phosphodiesterase family protein [Nocardioides dokdonensis]ANH40012.1 Type I phosphodiesterase / nucleotide pyrophosphatase [Nocardioides dokdonensis FR1436]